MTFRFGSVGPSLRKDREDLVQQPTEPLAWLKWVLMILAVCLVVGLGISTVARGGPYNFAGRSWGNLIHRSDFIGCRLAGQAVLDRTDLYAVHNQRVGPYIYPPPFAILMVPF